MSAPFGLRTHPPDRAKKLAARMRQRTIGRELREIYASVVKEPVPADIVELLRQIDENERRKQK